MRDPIYCTLCGVELTGGIDTYGTVGEELCQIHFLSDTDNDVTRLVTQLNALVYDQDREETEAWYDYQEKLLNIRNRYDTQRQELNRRLEDLKRQAEEAQQLRWEMA